MGIWGYLIIVAGALAIGLIAQFIGKAPTMYDWLITAFFAGVAAWVASELLGSVSTWGPEVDGLFVLPALIGGVVVGALVDGGERLVITPTTQ
ncbi:MAG: hypothetical protein J0I20_25395 [Chloroflexi bacterium]|nr:hypothetical protein [Chloroflexota bacterium]OJW01883.1 MAG: hypothetical protein BGO39_28465 [Chloroflexi bacterium 54-19]